MVGSARLGTILILVLAAAGAGMMSASGVAGAPGPRAGAGAIIGSIDGIVVDGEQSFVAGWACQHGVPTPIKVHVFRGDPGRRAEPILVANSEANFENEAAVDQACGDGPGHAHRFLVLLPPGAADAGRDGRLYVHGIRVVDGVPNDAIRGSGERLPLVAGAGLPGPGLPPLAGAYRSSGVHPRVFEDRAELDDMAQRIGRAGSTSGERFRQLAGRVRDDLASRVDWDAVYSGCRVKTYVYAFSYEPQETGFVGTLRSDLGLRPGADGSAGGAVVAARSALYAALLRAGVGRQAGMPSGEEAAGLARRILLAWADRGFRDSRGGFRHVSSFDCDDDGRPDARPDAGTGLGLALGRGAVYSVQAQDMLASLGALTAEEGRRLDAMHAALFDLIRQSSNKGYGTYQPACNRFANGQANAVAAMLAIARLLDDPARFQAALAGGGASVPAVAGSPVAVPWVRLFDTAVYGGGDVPRQCFANSGATAVTSHPSYQGPVAAAGEIGDRYRNANPLQGIGYAMFTLERLMNAAEVMRHSGYATYAYRGRHGQSLETAVAYYACLARAVGFGAVVVAERAGACPDAAQYDGKVVNGVDAMVLLGSWLFPGNPAITDLEADARRAAGGGPFATDALLFGKWRD